MQQFVKWDHENNKILIGPQSIAGADDNWYPLNEGDAVVNPATQTRQFVFNEDSQTVEGSISGSPELTWEQGRVSGYGSLEDQLDMLWHDIATNTLDKTGSFYLFIKGVKDSNPKSGD